MKEYKLYSNTLGINREITSESVLYNKNTGYVYMKDLVNMNIDVNGKVSSRPSFDVIKDDLAIDCIYDTGENLLLLSSGTLKESDYDLTTITDVAIGLGTNFYATTVDGTTYYSDGVTTGYYKNGICAAWELSSYPDREDSRILSPPPAGKFIKLYNGRIYLASGNTLWFTEALNYFAVDKSRNFFQMDGEIDFIESLPDGIIVGTAKGIYLLSGDGPDKFVKRKLVNCRNLKGSSVAVAAFSMNDEKRISEAFNEYGVIVTTTIGILFCSHDGSVKTITKKWIVDDIDFSEEATSLYLDRTYYLKPSNLSTWLISFPDTKITSWSDPNISSIYHINNTIYKISQNDILKINKDEYDTSSIAIMEFPVSNLGDESVKRLRLFEIEIKGKGKGYLSITNASGSTVTKEIVYEGNYSRKYRTFIPRSIYGSNFTITITFDAGSTFILESMSLISRVISNSREA